MLDVCMYVWLWMCIFAYIVASCVSVPREDSPFGVYLHSKSATTTVRSTSDLAIDLSLDT